MHYTYFDEIFEIDIFTLRKNSFLLLKYMVAPVQKRYLTTHVNIVLALADSFLHY